MPIISVDACDKRTYRLTLSLGCGLLENIVVTDDGTYDIYYIKNGRGVKHTGKIVNIVQNRANPKANYLLFDWSEDYSARRERIYFYQVQTIKDITPNNAYTIAVQHGFQGTIDEWLESMHGNPGKDAYEIAVECGFEGDRQEWLESLKGSRGYSAYEIAVQQGFLGTETEWLESLKGSTGKSAYDIAVEEGFQGTAAEWLLSLKGKDGDSAYELAVKAGFEGTLEEWLESLKGQSAYEAAVSKGFEGTEEDWFAQNGDTTVVKNQVNKVVEQIMWKTTM